MSTYAVSQEGVIALKTMSAAIHAAADKITSVSKDLKIVVEDNNNLLGPHVKSLEEVIENIDNEMKKASEPIGSISSILEDLANDYQEEIDSKPTFGGSGK